MLAPAPASQHAQFRAQPVQQQQNVQPSSSPAVDIAAGASAAEPSSPAEDDPDDDHMNDNDPQQNYGPAGSDEHGPIFNIPPPPENTYPNEEELERAIHEWSKEHGYELVRRASKRNAKGVLYKRYYHCSKHGKRANTGKLTEETRQRVNRKSGRQDCPMSLAAVAVDPTEPEGEWQIRHRKSHHNHGPMKALELAGHRRRARMGPVEQAIDGLFAIGTSTTQVLQFLQKTSPDGLFTRTDVANMKNRYKKWGTCADRIQRGDNHVSTARYKSINGIKIPCLRCRQKHLGCDNAKPKCGNCAPISAECEYSPGQEPQLHLAGDDETMVMDEGDSTQIDLTTPPPAQRRPQANSSTTQQSSAGSKRAKAVSASQPDAGRTQEILDNLKNFQAEHLKPQRLAIDSASVEVLAQSSCGNGDSYRNLPWLAAEKDWPAFKDAMREAALRENTWEVLTGAKSEPKKPAPLASAPALDVEVWNEYVRQLAIYNRRNSLLLSAILAKSGPMFKSRLHSIQSAAQAWNTLEDICAPRGSRTAYSIYCDIHSITLANSSSLQHYISRLESAQTQFKQLKLNTGPQSHGSARASRQQQQQATLPRSGDEALPEEQLIFLFLKGLGSTWSEWVESMTMTSNIGGFGTGERLGWKEVTRAVLRVENRDNLKE